MVYDDDTRPTEPGALMARKRSRFMLHYGTGDRDLREFLIDLHAEPKRSFWERFLNYLTRKP